MPNPRRRALLSREERKNLEEKEARVQWTTLLRFDESEDADDEPPFPHAPSFNDIDYHEHLLVECSYEWSGGLRFTVSDGQHETKFMLHTRQVELLMEAADVWNRGRMQDWLEEQQAKRDAAKKAAEQ